MLPHVGVKSGKLKKKKLLALEMDFWPRSSRRSRRENVRNEVIIEKIDKNNTVLDDFGQSS
jgi:ribosomal protein S6E (S10)